MARATDSIPSGLKEHKRNVVHADKDIRILFAVIDNDRSVGYPVFTPFVKWRSGNETRPLILKDTGTQKSAALKSPSFAHCCSSRRRNRG